MTTMLKAIFYKEWLKTSRTFAVCLLVGIAIAVYVALGINRIVVNKGVDHVWLIMLMKDQLFINAMRYVPLLIGLAIGVSQMAPEMSHKRLKLTLHLPYSSEKLIGLMLLTGLAELLLIFVTMECIVFGYESTMLPYELVNRGLLSTLPWLMGGFMAYLFATAVCLEGTWKNRILLGLMGTGVLSVMYMQDAPEGYNGMLLMLMIMMILTIALTYRSVYRFKEGRQ